MNINQKIFLTFIILLSFSFSFFIAVHFVDRGHYYGDGPSNDAAWYGGKNFNKLGFLRMRGVPIQVTGVEEVPSFPVDPHNTPFYFHYPAGPDLMQGVLFRLGLENRLYHQVFGLLFSIVGSFFAWKFLSGLFDHWPALIAFSFFVLTPNFLFFADNLHGHAYFTFFHWFFLYQIFILFKLVKEKKSVSYIKFAFTFLVLGIVASWFSIDLIPPMLILGLVCFFTIPGRDRWTWGIALMLAAVIGDIAGFTLHVCKNGLVLGGFHSAVTDFLDAFMTRAGHVVGPVHVTYNGARHFGKFLLGVQWFFTFPFLILACVGWFTILKKNRNGFWLGLFLASLIGSVFWQFFMKQHGMIHAFTYRHMEVFAVIGVALFFQFLRPRNFRIWAPVMIAYLILHSSLGVFQVEGTPMKKAVIKLLIPQNDLGNWACAQEPRLKITTELVGAKQIIEELKKKNCGDSNYQEKLGSRLAEAALFWR